jgi:SpoVK/Ycf46/Vps4 family AAA+-type ATPase
MKPTPLSELVKTPKGDPNLEALKQYGDLRMPEESEAPILNPAVRESLRQLMMELQATPEELAAVGLKHRSRGILDGPPGTGKTTLIHHVAARLGMNLLVVEAANVASKYVNQSAEQVAKLFALARQVDVVLFLDEIDALATNRSDSNGSVGQEANKVVIALLQQLDRHDGMVFAATNRRDIIDPAIWRRFNMQITVDMPQDEQRFAIVKRYSLPLLVEDETIAVIAHILEGASPALIKNVMEGMRRDHVFGPKLGQSMDAPSVFRRIASSCAPADIADQPILWSDQDKAFALLADAPWPPQLPKAA